MSKKQAIFIVLVSVVVTLAVNFVAGRYITAKISTWPLLNRWKILSPQAPIVITNNQTVRISDSGDARQAAQQIKSKISTIVLVNNNVDTVVGFAVNLTSDGSFISASASFNGKANGNYFVVLSDGTQAQVGQKVSDPATSLTFFKAALNNVSVQSLDNSGDLAVGDKVVFVENSLENSLARVTPAVIGFSQNDIAGQTLQSDYPRRSFGAFADEPLSLGEVVVDSGNNIVGIYNGSNIVSSDVLKTAISVYFNNQNQIIRPAFGFSYSIVTQNEAKLTGLPQGARVLQVNLNSPAHLAALAVGDVITAIDGQQISESALPEPLLEKYHPGDKINLSVSRNRQTLSLVLVAGTLK